MKPAARKLLFIAASTFFLLVCTPSSVFGQTSDDYSGFEKETEITRQTNSKLLPRILKFKKESNEENCSGWQIGPACINIPLIHKTKILPQETEYLQPLFVSVKNVESIDKGCSGIDLCQISRLKDKLINKQIEEPKTGALNDYRPNNLEFDLVDADASPSGTPEKKDQVKSSYVFTQKMLLPKSLGYLAIPPTSTPTPTPTIYLPLPLPTAAPTPDESILLTPTPTIYLPLPGARLNLGLRDPKASENLNLLVYQVSEHFRVPQSIIASVSWIEGRNVWKYESAKILQYSLEGNVDPVWEGNNLLYQFKCRANAWTAAGPMQFTIGQWNKYGNSAREATASIFDSSPLDRDTLVCNIMDAFYAAGKKLRSDSKTSRDLDWDKEAVANAGWRYYGACGKCDESSDPDLAKGVRDKYACNRLGMSYCEYMWRYKECNEQKETYPDFEVCATEKGLSPLRN